MLPVLPVLSEHEIRRTSERYSRFFLASEDRAKSKMSSISAGSTCSAYKCDALDRASLPWFSHRLIDAVEGVFRSREQTGLDFD